MMGLSAAYDNSLGNEIEQSDDEAETGTKAAGRQGDERSRAAGPFPGGACGRDAEGEIPEARRPALAPAEMARGRGRAGRAARRISGLARYAAPEP